MLVVCNTDSVDSSLCAKCNRFYGVLGEKINARPGDINVRIGASARVEQDRNKRPAEIPMVDRPVGRCDRWISRVILGGFDGF